MFWKEGVRCQGARMKGGLARMGKEGKYPSLVLQRMGGYHQKPKHATEKGGDKKCMGTILHPAQGGSSKWAKRNSRGAGLLLMNRVQRNKNGYEGQAIKTNT